MCVAVAVLLQRLVYLKEQRTFLIKCRNEGLFSAHIQNFSNKFIIHNLHYKVIFKFQNTIFNTQKKLLNCEINNTVENIHELGRNSNYSKYRLLRNIKETSLFNFFQSQDMMLQNLKFNIRGKCDKKFQLLRDRNTKLCQFRVNKCF